MIVRGIVISAILFGLLGSVGCYSTRERLQRKAQLSKLAMEYHWFNSNMGRSPTNVDEFADFVSARIADPEPYTSTSSEHTSPALKKLRNGELVFVWSADLTTHDDDNDPFVLGYESDIAENGGFMVSGGGLVSLVTATEFADTPAIPVKLPSVDSD